MTKMINATLDEKYQQRKFVELCEKVYLADARAIKEAKGDKTSPMSRAFKIINDAFLETTKLKNFESLLNAKNAYEKKLKDAKGKRLDLAKTLVLGISLFDTLINGFDNKFDKILEEVNINLEKEGKEKTTLATYHAASEEDDESDDLEEEDITPEMVNEAIEKIKKNFSPGEEYKSLLKLPAEEKIFELDQFRIELEKNEIKDISELRKLIKARQNAISDIDKDLPKLTKKSEGTSDLFNEYLMKLITKSGNSQFYYSDSDKLQKALGAPPGETGREIIKKFYDKIVQKTTIKEFSRLEEEEQIKRLVSIFGEDYSSLTKIPQIKLLLQIMREKTK